MSPRFPLLFTLVCCLGAATASLPAAEPPVKRVLLLGSKPDSHPPTTHEYMAGVRLLATLLQRQPNVTPIVIQADEPWKEGPELMDSADGAVVFLTEGASWLSRDPRRLAAFQRLASRKGGLAVPHWGMGTRDAAPIENFVKLFGACHGGPDRKYKVGEFAVSIAAADHPATRGLKPFTAHDEFYYALKTLPPSDRLTSLLKIEVDESTPMVGWAWERPDGGRSFGFSGGHFHANWKLPEYRRLMTQGVLWTLGREIPPKGVTVDVTERDLELPARD